MMFSALMANVITMIQIAGKRQFQFLFHALILLIIVADYIIKSIIAIESCLYFYGFFMTWLWLRVKLFSSSNDLGPGTGFRQLVVFSKRKLT